jgi:hypothetical protein
MVDEDELEELKELARDTARSAAKDAYYEKAKELSRENDDRRRLGEEPIDQETVLAECEAAASEASEEAYQDALQGFLAQN